MTTKNLLLKAKKQVYGDRLGNHASKLHGEGFEFSELREYEYGDDVRKIDWKSSAKTGKTQLKVYNEERELNVVVASMVGGSTYFGTDRQKSDVITEVVSLIGTSALGTGDSLANYLFANRLISNTKPSKRFFSLYTTIEQMRSHEPLGLASNYLLMRNELEKRLKKKSLLFIVADFVGDIDFARLSKRHDVVFLIIRDRYEENPTPLGAVGLVDAESGMSLFGNMDSNAIQNYKKALSDNDAKVVHHCTKYGIRYLKIYTDENIYLALKKGIR